MIDCSFVKIFFGLNEDELTFFATQTFIVSLQQATLAQTEKMMAAVQRSMSFNGEKIHTKDLIDFIVKHRSMFLTFRSLIISSSIANR